MAAVSGRRRLALGFVALLAVAAIAAGCAPSNTPDQYNTLTEQNFLELCTNRYYDNTDDVLTSTDRTIAPDVTAPSEEICSCQYQVFVEQVPINDDPQNARSGYTGPTFTELNADLKKNPEEAWNALPSSVRDAVSACATGAPTDGSGSSGAPSTATTVPTETTTPS